MPPPYPTQAYDKNQDRSPKAHDPTPGKDERQDLGSNIFFFHEGSLLGHG